MFEIVERSMQSGGVSQIYSSYLTEQDAIEDAEIYASENPDYWYEVRKQRY